MCYFRGVRVLRRSHPTLDELLVLDGNREEIVGRLGVLLDQLSDCKLASIGLQRVTVVEAVQTRSAPN